MRKIFDYFKIRFNIIWINAVNTFRQESAYFGNNWGSLASAVFYILAMLLFIEILYSNINMFSGYGKNDMLFLVFVSQFAFYIQCFWSQSNLVSMYEGVRGGELDFILTKPVSSIFYVTFKKIHSIGFLRDSLPNLILMCLLINWRNLSLKLALVFLGIIIFFLGQIAWHCFKFLFMLPVFWCGEAKQTSSIATAFETTSDIPLEGFEKPLRWIFITVIPSISIGQLSVSVMLGKSNGLKMLILSLIVATIFVSLKIFFWNLALKNYTSASS